MGSMLSTLFFQPLLLGTAATLMIVALIYQQSVSICGNEKPVKWGQKIFNILMGISVVVLITAILNNFVAAIPHL